MLSSKIKDFLKNKCIFLLLTDLPDENDDIIMLESSPPLTIRVLFMALVTHITAAMCSL